MSHIRKTFETNNKINILALREEILKENISSIFDVNMVEQRIAVYSYNELSELEIIQIENIISEHDYSNKSIIEQESIDLANNLMSDYLIKTNDEIEAIIDKATDLDGIKKELKAIATALLTLSLEMRQNE